MPYSWEPKDDLIALLLFKLNADTATIKQIASEIGCPHGSLKKRIQNIEYLHCGTGKMYKASIQTKQIYKKHKNLL